MPATAPIARDQLIGLEDGLVHLCSGSEAPLPRAALDAFARHVSARAQGARGRVQFETMLEDLRRRMAALLGDPDHPDRVAFLSSAGHAIDTVARLIAWRPGDSVLTLTDEFPSVILSWAPIHAQGVAVRAVTPGQNPEEALLGALEPGTRAVCVSHVSFRTGMRLDLARLAAELRPRGILLIVDASHSLGVIRVPTEHCDVVMSCGHKFLFGLHGTGILYLRHEGLREAATEAPLGWYSVEHWELRDGAPDVVLKQGARSLEIGNPAFLTLATLSEGLRLLEEVGFDVVERHAMGLAETLRGALVARGLPCWTPSDPARHGTSIAIPYPRGEALHTALLARDIVATNKSGRLRLSFHGYNTQADIDAVLEVVDAGF